VTIPEFGTPEPGAVYQLRPGAHTLIVEEARVVVVRTRIGLMLPGGGIDAGESAEQAALRETREEVGLRVELGRDLGTADELVFARGEQRHYRKRARFFAARIVGGAAPTEDDHEMAWLATADALSQLAYGSHRWALERFLGMR
jgi:8-oxo-dGTP pyrophosphatase MutT (NUDIX family)